MQKEGKVRYIGVSNFNVAQMNQVARIAPITSLQPNYNIVTRDIEYKNSTSQHPLTDITLGEGLIKVFIATFDGRSNQV
jgi:aryl-alcohol dehydrogenase-like predicted oxidoreductase